MAKKRPSGKIQLPPKVSFTKERIGGAWAYVFRHTELGNLGRVLLQGRPDGRTQLSLEVAGDPDDPMTEKRAAIFKPLGMAISQGFDNALGGAKDLADTGDAPPPPWQPPKGVESKLMPCEKCDEFVAALIFAAEARNRGGLEDYARMMYPKMKEWNLPTWVIGPPMGDGPLEERKSDILKVWPEREPIERLSPEEFNPRIEKLMTTHCLGR